MPFFFDGGGYIWVDTNWAQVHSNHYHEMPLRGVEVLKVVNHLAMSRPLCWSFSLVKQLEGWSASFGRYFRNWLSFTALHTYSWQLKMEYCNLHILMKTVSCKVTMIENQHFNCNNFNIHSWSYLELHQLLAADKPSHKQVNLTQMLTKCQVDVM